jgi:hypothetical protein
MRFALAAATVVLFAILVATAMAVTPKPDSPKATARGYVRLKVGETTQRVVGLLGRNFAVCPSCPAVTWIYRTGLNDPVAIVVRFEHGALVSRFLVRPQPNL